ncbi:MAG: hypothetical protein JWP76_3408 [Dactylosporangium sp.]|jgi:hypothetical protein|nr:hypothetical protein [Dactylosporangium sp.]
MTTETTVEQESAAGSVGAVTDEQLISMLVDRAARTCAVHVDGGLAAS